MLNRHFHSHIRLLKRKNQQNNTGAGAADQAVTHPTAQAATTNTTPRLKDWWRGAGYQHIEQELKRFNPVSRLVWRLCWSLTALLMFLTGSLVNTFAQATGGNTSNGIGDIQKASDAIAGDIQQITVIVIFVCLLGGGFLLLIGGINERWMQKGIRIIGGVIVGAAFIFIIAKPLSSFIKGFNTNSGNTNTTGMIITSLLGF